MKPTLKLKNIFTSRPMAALVALAVSLPLGSCDKYLDVEPEGQLTDATFWTTPDDAKRGVNGIYNMLRQSGFNEGLFPMLDIMSDDARKGSNPGDALGNIGEPYENYRLLPTTENHTSWYFTLYQGIRRANAAIEKVPGIPMDEALRNRYVAEARFLRAVFYLDLARAFGNVPFVTTLQPPPVESVRQAKDIEIYNEIIKPDLEFAAANLPPTYTGNDLGRATKGAAHALLARAALFFKEFDVARDQAEAVMAITEANYGLEDDFSMAFRPEGNFGKESVFEIGAIGNEPFFSQDRGGNQYGNVQGVRGTPNRGWGFKRPTVALLRAFTPGDQRKEKTVIRVGEVLDGITISGDASTPDFTLNDANRTADPTVAPGDTVEYEMYNEKVWTPGIDVPSAFGYHRRFIRFADVLLMAAEAHIETGNLGRAAELINRVRARARGGNPDAVPDVQVVDQNQMREAVYNERRLELALEDTRFYDLVRTGRTDLLVPYGFIKGKHEHLPIPQVERDISGGKIQQNPGY